MELGGSHKWELNSCVSLNYSTNMGYLAEEGDFTAWTNRLSLDWGFAEHAKVSPFIGFSIGASSDYDNEFLGGSMLSVTF
jgi:hypothetical protein